MILSRVLRGRMSYQSTFGQALKDPVGYWREQAKFVKWEQFPNRILTVHDLHFHRWFPDGKINISQQCIDVHLKDRANQPVFFYESPITQTVRIASRSGHPSPIKLLAGAMKTQFGIQPGDRVIIYMPMTIESLIAIHACARIAATHVVVFGGFAAHQLANRIEDSQPKLVICANAGKQPSRVINYLKIVNQALKQSGKSSIPKIIHQRANLLQVEPLQANQFDFHQIQKAGYRSSAVIVDANHPLYILYTSGTTGRPKGVIRDHGGTAVLLHHAMRRIFNAVAGDSMFCSSDIGWVLGHSFIVYAPLLIGMKSVVFQGKPVGTPSPDVFWQLIDRLKIDHLYTSPTAIRTIRKQDSDGRYIRQHNLSNLKCVSLVGERCDIPTFQWVQEHFKGKLVNDNYWQTETGGPILSNYLGFKTFPEKPGSACKPLPGYDVRVLNSSTGYQCRPNEVGTLYIREPLPPSFMLTILNNDDKFVDKYFSTISGHYNTGDSGYYDEDGYFYVMSRQDDVINTAGHRLSTGEMEEILMKHKQIAEAIVIGATDQIKGEIPVAFVTIKNQHLQNQNESQVAKECITLIREQIGPVASFKHCYVVPRMPRTRSGKYLRHIVRKMFNKQSFEVPSTIEDIDVVAELEHRIEKIHRENL